MLILFYIPLQAVSYQNIGSSLIETSPEAGGAVVLLLPGAFVSGEFELPEFDPGAFEPDVFEPGESELLDEDPGALSFDVP